MRTGEVCVLTWDKVDLEKRIISIEHNVYSKVKDEKGKWFLGTTKTINGVRKVYICDTLLVAIKRNKKILKSCMVKGIIIIIWKKLKINMEK